MALKGFDIPIASLNSHLEASLPWTHTAYGRAAKYVKRINGKRVYLPVVFRDSNEYIDLSPNSTIGNFSFWEVKDDQEISQDNESLEFRCDAYMVFWFDLRTIAGAENRNTEYVKNEVLTALKSATLWQGSFRPYFVQEEMENVYRGYSLDEVENQFFTHPFYALRVTGRLKTGGERC